MVQSTGSSERLALGLAKLSVLGIAAATAYALYRHPYFPTCCFSSDENSEPDPDHADRLAKIRMLAALQGYPGIKVFGALRIPDTGHKEHKEIDLVILTKRKLCLVEVKSWAGIVKCEVDGSWCQMCEDGSLLKHGNIVEEVKKRAALLESYLFRRGLKLPFSFIRCMVVIANPHCRVDETILPQPGVFSLQQWESFLRKEAQKSMFGWMKIKGLKKRKVMPSDLYQQLHNILSTAPTWDRLSFEGGDIIFGDFLHFNGLAEDLEALKMVKRSRISEVSVTNKQEHTSHLLGLCLKTISLAEVSCTLRDYRRTALKKENKDKAESEWHATVNGDTEVVFQAVGTTRPQVFKVNTVVAIHLSA